MNSPSKRVGTTPVGEQSGQGPHGEWQDTSGQQEASKAAC